MARTDWTIKVETNSKPARRTLALLKFAIRLPMPRRAKIRLLRAIVRIMRPRMRYRMDGGKWYTLLMDIEVHDLLRKQDKASW